jgi:hypothetical protein
MRTIFVCLAIMLLISSAIPQPDDSLVGSWELLPDKSTDIDLYKTLTVKIQQTPAGILVVDRWGGDRHFLDSLLLPVDGRAVQVPIMHRVFPSNVFMGLMMPVGEQRTVKATWDKRRLRLDETFPLRGSQGIIQVSAVRTYELSADGELLIYQISRSTRTSGPEMKFRLKRSGTRHAFAIRLQDDWNINSKLDVQAFYISLQGVANKTAPRLYLLYPDDWPFTYVQSVYDFYKEKRHFTFVQLRTPEEALRALRSEIKGYVVWDKNVRTSLIVAYTAAGLERAVVVSEEMIPLVEGAGLKKVEDLRGLFTGQTDAQIYSWAYKKYWHRCSKEFIVWLGGEHGTVMKPAVADWGMHKEAFFSDLSSRPADSVEYALARTLLSEMKPMSMIMGWHSYVKDLERDHVKLTSMYGHRVEGLNTLPNLSFSAQIPASPGFVYRNNHHVVPGKDYAPEKKVYISCIQTDGIGLGAWLRPGRGEIPYAWEVLMNYTWMAPGMAEYFYTMATPNDYFIGCLSGPGYMYPKAVPKKLLPLLIGMAREQMKTLDLKVFETMDYSEGATVEGNTDLPRAIVDEYLKGMPEAIGFVNGYAPSYTFTARDGRAFVSYDYYLSPERPVPDAVADIEELARVNPKRPYFLLVHVRESSDVKRVKSILDRLGPEFENVPLDVFLTMAGKQTTFEERYRVTGPSGDTGIWGD